jgi:hypothetical protein
LVGTGPREKIYFQTKNSYYFFRRFIPLLVEGCQYYVFFFLICNVMAFANRF